MKLFAKPFRRTPTDAPLPAAACADGLAASVFARSAFGASQHNQFASGRASTPLKTVLKAVLSRVKPSKNALRPEVAA